MIWARKGLVHILAFLLLVSLLGGTLAFSANLALSRPAKLENWLADSKLYDHFVANAIAQVKQSTSQDTGSSGISLSDPAVQQAAESAFPSQLVRQSVDTFLDSNYAWLQGKTTKPEFVIDLTAARQTFAQKVGQYAATRLTSLPACTPLQEAQLVNPNDVDVLSVNCRPAALSPAAANAQVTQEINASSGFLSQPIITAQTINPKSSNGSQPYYVKLAKAPRIYRLAQKLPLALGVLALLTTLGIILVAPARRKGVRRVGAVLFAAGIILVASGFAADATFNQAEKRIFNDSGIGQIQQSLVDFARRVQHQIVGVDSYFGIAFLIIAVAIFGYLVMSRKRTDKPKPSLDETPVSEETPQAIQLAPRPRGGPLLDVMPPNPKPSGPPPLKVLPPAATQPAKPPRPRGRLVQ